ncbi:hypothetical protein IEQ34_004008 [Dendrobium chrysotoxum]|nr:hypothetical protein IEQ34_004008 [Dendrobium chrysotoxum]
MSLIKMIQLEYGLHWASRIRLLPEFAPRLEGIPEGIKSFDTSSMLKVYIISISGIDNLSNLRYLELLEKYISLIRGIGKLKFLQELNMFELRSEMGYKIEELEYLNELCKLGNNCLENVKDAEEACNAKS